MNLLDQIEGIQWKPKDIVVLLALAVVGVLAWLEDEYIYEEVFGGILLAYVGVDATLRYMSKRKPRLNSRVELTEVTETSTPEDVSKQVVTKTTVTRGDDLMNAYISIRFEDAGDDVVLEAKRQIEEMLKKVPGVEIEVTLTARRS